MVRFLHDLIVIPDILIAVRGW